MAEKCIIHALTFTFLGSYYPVANMNTSSYVDVTVGVFACYQSVFSLRENLLLQCYSCQFQLHSESGKIYEPIFPFFSCSVCQIMLNKHKNISEMQ